MADTVLVLAGDGIGMEVSAPAEKVLLAVAAHFGLRLRIEHALIGGAALDDVKDPLPADTLARARDSVAVLLGAVGGPKWDAVDRESRPEKGLLRLRSELALFANLRPVRSYAQLLDASPLKSELLEDLDLMIVRELTGGLYFGTPRGIRKNAHGVSEGYNTMVYAVDEIERIARVAFGCAAQRTGQVCSVDKANVLETSVLWRETVSSVAQDYPQISLEHMYVDNAAMQLVRAPKRFDVIVTGNLFGDVLSDLASVLTGSIGMLASASLNDSSFGVYEPCHGAAPDIAGRDIANPLAAILSVAMMLRYSMDCAEAADAVEAAVLTTLEAGYRTADIASSSDSVVGCAAMGDAVLDALAHAA